MRRKKNQYFDGNKRKGNEKKNPHKNTINK